MSVMFESPHYLILLSLAGGPKHGLAVQRQIVGDTLGVFLPNMTIYDTLKSLLERDMVDMRHFGRRKVYQITEKGNYHLEMASRSKRETARLAQQRLGYR